MSDTPLTFPENRLAQESSLYLRQHARNPVDWFPWGAEALDTARQLNRPIFLSIGYSACHWCHVMEHESFENPDTAAIMNAHFVCIKVDREERPDIDQIYMTALQVMTREGGGWPLSVFLTPELKPFYAGTYFPPDNRYGRNRPSFPKLLRTIREAWETTPDQLRGQANEVTHYLQSIGDLQADAGDLKPSHLRHALDQLRRSFDASYGGFGEAPKFPHAIELRLLLRGWKRFDDDTPLEMVKITLEKMGRGGIYDHLGGGFARYSVDARWLVPHFEKMLYDNALLLAAYVDGWHVTGEDEFRRTAEETIDYLRREMTAPNGAFFSTQDADSEGEEGKFYVWSFAEVQSLLDGETAKTFCYVYGVTPEGNFEGRNILHRAKSDEQDARMLGIPLDLLQTQLAQARGKLFAVRSQRIWPGRDEKILTSWNALMISSLAHAGATLQRPDVIAMAVRAAEAILTAMRRPDGQLYRTMSMATAPKLNAYLEDYAFLIAALIELHQATYEPRWIVTACELCEVMIGRFADPSGPGFYFTAIDHEALISRNKDSHDGSMPSGNSMAAMALLRLGALIDRADWTTRAVGTINAFLPLIQRSPTAAGQMLCAYDFHLGPQEQITILGHAGDAETQRALAVVRQGYHPNRLVVFHDPASGPAPVDVLPWLRDRPMLDGVTCYICRDQVCAAPIVGAAAFAAELGHAGDELREAF